MLTEGLPRPTHMAAMGVHKAIGVTILVLTIVRIAWRIGHTAPPLPAAVPAWQRPLSTIVHFLFYALLILLPLSGWVRSEEHTSELQSIMRISYAVFCLKKIQYYPLSFTVLLSP